MMFYPAQILIIPGVLILILAFFLSILFFLFSLYKREKEFQQKQARIIDEYNEIIEQAHGKARKIIDQASTEAQNLLSQTQESKSNLDQSVRDAFMKLTQDQVQLLHTNSDEYAKDYQVSLQEVKDHYKASLEGLLKQIKEQTEKELTGSQESMHKKIQDEFSKTQIEINDYKRHQLQKIDQSIIAMIAKIAEEVLGKAISLRDHQSLIFQSLEQAKKDGMFET